jgi:membrane-associated phospholipid phosphatase
MAALDRSSARAVVFEHPPLSRRALVRLGIGALLVVLVGVVVGAAVDAVSPIPPEEQLLDAVVEGRDPALTAVARMISELGSFWWILGASVVLLPLLRVLTRGWEAPVLYALALLGSLALTGAIKFTVVRDRPLQALVDTHSPAFPSGHASRSIALLGLAIWAVVVLVRLPPVRAALVGVLVAGVLAMGWSRIYLTVHWPTDVLVGWVVGAWWLLVLLRAVQPRLVPLRSVPPDEPQIATPDRADR